MNVLILQVFIFIFLICTNSSHSSSWSTSTSSSMVPTVLAWYCSTSNVHASNHSRQCAIQKVLIVGALENAGIVGKEVCIGLVEGNWQISGKWKGYALWENRHGGKMGRGWTTARYPQRRSYRTEDWKSNPRSSSHYAVNNTLSRIQRHSEHQWSGSLIQNGGSFFFFFFYFT